VVEATRHGTRMRFVAPGLKDVPHVLAPMLTGGFYEEPFLRYVRSLRLRGTYVDVGAHLGTHTVWFAMQCPAVHVHAFEPVNRYRSLLRENLALNALERTVTVHAIGLGAAPGRASNTLSSSHEVGFSTHPQERVEWFEVGVLDALVREPVSLIKLDVEGMESMVLQGASRILEDDGPVVFAEAHGREQRQAILDVLAPAGYVATGRVFNETPTFEFRRPRRRVYGFSSRLAIKAQS
jgi:FkbM family methyltransferase